MSYDYPSPDTTPGSSPAPSTESEPALGPAIDLQPSSTPAFEGPANDYPAARVLTYGDHLAMPVPMRLCQTHLLDTNDNDKDIFTIHDTTTTKTHITTTDHTFIPTHIPIPIPTFRTGTFRAASDYRPSPPPDSPSPGGTPPPPDGPKNYNTFNLTRTIFCPTTPASRGCADAIAGALADCHRHEAPRPA